MQVKIVRNDIAKSTIDMFKRIEDLPQGLREIMWQLLNDLDHDLQVKDFAFPDDQLKQTVFELPEENIHFNALDERLNSLEKQPLKDIFKNTLSLYLWYKKDHWKAEGLSNNLRCIECNTEFDRTRMSKEEPNLCLNKDCPSQEKWQLIYGTDYQEPQ